MHAFCSSFTKLLSTKSFHARFVVPQNPSIDTCFVIKAIISCENLIAIGQMKRSEARFFFLSFTDKNFSGDKRMPELNPGLRAKITKNVIGVFSPILITVR